MRGRGGYLRKLLLRCSSVSAKSLFCVYWLRRAMADYRVFGWALSLWSILVALSFLCWFFVSPSEIFLPVGELASLVVRQQPRDTAPCNDVRPTTNLCCCDFRYGVFTMRVHPQRARNPPAHRPVDALLDDDIRCCRGWVVPMRHAGSKERRIALSHKLLSVRKAFMRRYRSTDSFCRKGVYCRRWCEITRLRYRG